MTGSQVYCSAAPHLGILTITAAEDVQSQTQGVHTLLVEDDAGVTLRNGVFVVFVEKGICLGYAIEDSKVSC